MNYIHDIIKIMYVREGYLPNYPYHLIADDEMMFAFLHNKKKRNYIDTSLSVSSWEEAISVFSQFRGYFMDRYMTPYLKRLVDDMFPFDNDYYLAIVLFVNNIYSWCLQVTDATSEVKLPDWVYSYMIGRVFGPKSDTQDLHDLFVLLDKVGMLGTTIDNLDDEFTAAAGYGCYQVSKKCVNKLSKENKRPAGMFGENAVIKYCRIYSSN